MAQVYTLPDYLNGFLNLMPTGRIWDKDPESNLVAAVTPLIPTYQRLSDRAVALIQDAFVPTTAELLPEWMASLGLPDPCLGYSAPTATQVNQAVARFVGLGGQSVAYFLAYAAALGYNGTTITQYATFKAGSGKAGQGNKIVAPGTAFSWLVTSPPSALLYFKAGSGTAGQKLITVLNNVLQCEFDDLKPAHTKAYYSFATTSTTTTTTTTVLPAGAFATSGNQIVDPSGNPMRIYCITWSGGHSRNAGLDGLGQIAYQTALNMMLSFGFNTVRILTYDRGVLNNSAMAGVNYTIGSNSDLIGLTYLGVIDKILDYCVTIGMRVIITSHNNEGGSNSNDRFGLQQPNGLWYSSGTGFGGTGTNLTTDGSNAGTITDALFLGSWQARASRWKAKPALLGYDIRNEPSTGTGTNSINWGAGGANDLRAMYQRVGKAIQALDPRPLIICEGFQNFLSTPQYPSGDLTQAQTYPVVLTVPNKVVYSVHEYPNEAYPVTTSSTPVTIPGSGFRVYQGKVYGPNNLQFVPKGLAVGDGTMSVAVTNAACSPLLDSAEFLGINLVRLACGDGYNPPSYYDDFISKVTAKGVVVHIEDHSGPDGGDGVMFDAATQNAQAAWYAALATFYINNPYVTFGTLNEPPNAPTTYGVVVAGTATLNQVKIYNAIRATGNNTLIEMEMVGGGTPDGFGYTTLGKGTGLGNTIGLYPISSYAPMTNIVWGPHFYYWMTSETVVDTVHINAVLDNILSLCAEIPTADGTAPVWITEFGPTYYNEPVVAAGTALCTAVMARPELGSFAWAWGPYDGTNGTCGLPDGSDYTTLTTWGLKVRTWARIIVTPPANPTTTSTSTVTTPDTGAAYVTQMNAGWGYLVKNNIAPVFVGAMGDAMQTSDAVNWGNTIVPYLNGVAANGPSFASPKLGISWGWWNWAFGDNGTNFYFGVLTAWAGGSIKLAQATYISALVSSTTVVVTAPVATFWDSATKSATITLSGGNLIATSATAVPQTVRGTTAKSTGKVYFEVTMNTASTDWACGVVTSGYSFNNGSGLGSDSFGVGFYAVSPPGSIFINTVGGLAGSAPDVSGAVIGVAIDFAARLMWVTSPQLRIAGGWNGTNNGNPEVGTGGVDISQLAVGPYYVAYNNLEAGAATLNCGGTAFNQVIPVGFVAWNSLP